MALGGTVRGERATLRMPTPEDLSAYQRWSADLRVRREVRYGEPALPAVWKERLTEESKDRTSVLWSIETAGRIVGVARVGFAWAPLADGAIIRSFLIDPDEWRRGLGFDAALALHRYLFDYLRLRWTDRALAVDNLAGRRIAAQLGYTEYGRGHAVYYRDGAYLDQVWLRMDVADWDARWAATQREYPPLGATS